MSINNSSEVSSYENSVEHESDEDFKVKLPVGTGMTLRQRRQQGYFNFLNFHWPLLPPPSAPFFTQFTLIFLKSIFLFIINIYF